MEKVKVYVVKRKLKRGYSYAVRWTDPRTGKRRTESAGKDKVYANTIAAERRRLLCNGLYRDIRSVSYDNFTVEHLTAIESQLSKASYAEHERTLKQFKDVCDPKDLTVIDYAMLEQFRNSRVKDGISPATVNKCLRTLQSILERAVKRGYIKVNPFQGNRRSLWVKEKQPVPKNLEIDEFLTLYNACADDRWRGIVTVGYYAGLRQGEILALEWSDIDFDKKVLHVHNKEDFKTKSGKNRSVPMAAEVITVLQTLQHSRFKSSNIFAKCGEGGKQKKSNVSRDFSILVKRAGLVDDQGRPRFTMHDLRRSFVTNLLATGTDPKSVQALAGHSSVTTTLNYYAAVRTKGLTAAIDRLSKLATEYA